MFTQDIKTTQKPVSATATNPAIPSTAVLRLRSENGTTDRANSLLGNLTVAHSPTKEFGGGFRHVPRLNLRPQGDIPGAAVYGVIVHQDSLVGEARAVQAFFAWLNALVQLDGKYVLHEDDIVDTNLGIVSGLRLATNTATEVDWDEIFQNLAISILPRLLGRES